MARQSYKKNISPPKSIKRKRPVRNRKQGAEKVEGVKERLKKGFARRNR
jgi:hypothetical protein